MKEEIARRTAKGQMVPALRATIEAAIIHPIDCALYGYRDAGVRAVSRLLDN